MLKELAQRGLDFFVPKAMKIEVIEMRESRNAMISIKITCNYVRTLLGHLYILRTA